MNGKVWLAGLSLLCGACAHVAPAEHLGRPVIDERIGTPRESAPMDYELSEDEMLARVVERYNNARDTWRQR